MSHLKKIRFNLTFSHTKKNIISVCEKIKNPEIVKAQRALIKGYKEMGSINLSLAQECAEADSESLRLCEEKLTECE